MNTAMLNPFPGNTDRHQLWELVVRRDLEAFMAQDWNGLKEDFIEEDFFGIDGRMLTSIDSWMLTFPTLEAYGREWRKQAADYGQQFRKGRREALYEATKLSNIEIVGDTALVHRKFDGCLPNPTGQWVKLQWQTLYVCRKCAGRWKIASFAGYLPSITMENGAPVSSARKDLEPTAWQHVHSLSDVSALKSLLAEIEQQQESGMTADERQWLERAFALLKLGSAQPVNFPSVAARLGVSYEVFRHRFRRLTSMSPHRYRQSKVIERASELLRTTRYTLAKIADELGFCDEFHFSRSFKKLAGKSPTEFRRECLERG